MKPDERIKVYFDIEQDESGYPPVVTEFLWCKPTVEGTYIIDNIPFFVRDLSLGDTIAAKKTGKIFQFTDVIKKSKNTTVRILLKKPEIRERIKNALDGFGCTSEFMDKFDLLAISMSPRAQIPEALTFLDQEADKGNIGMEESSVRYQ